MNISSPDQQLRSYLLGRLDEGEEEKVEQRLLADGEFLDELDMVENELIDEYVHRRLSDEERALFERHRLQTPQQKQKLAFATALHEASGERADSRAKVVTLAERAPKRTLFSPAVLKIAAVVVVAAGLAIALWFLLGRESEVDRGMLALNQAYKNERLVESRISEMNYSPLPQTRGGESPNIDGLARRQAELTFLEAVRTRGDAASHHALGRLYLAEKSFDKAKQELEQSVKLDPNNAQIHSDLAAVLLELGRNAEEGQRLQYFAQALEHFNRALELNPSLPEALFNRALLYQQMNLVPQAREAWQKYLQTDTTSPWAAEARQKLTLLETKEKESQERKGYLQEQFARAYTARDKQAAWSAINKADHAQATRDASAGGGG